MFYDFLLDECIFVEISEFLCRQRGDFNHKKYKNQEKFSYFLKLFNIIYSAFESFTFYCRSGTEAFFCVCALNKDMFIPPPPSQSGFSIEII